MVHVEVMAGTSAQRAQKREKRKNNVAWKRKSRKKSEDNKSAQKREKRKNNVAWKRKSRKKSEDNKSRYQSAERQRSWQRSSRERKRKKEEDDNEENERKRQEKRKHAAEVERVTNWRERKSNNEQRSNEEEEMDNNSSAAGDSTESSELGRMSLDDSNNSGNGVDSDAQKMLETLRSIFVLGGDMKGAEEEVKAAAEEFYTKFSAVDETGEVHMAPVCVVCDRLIFKHGDASWLEKEVLLQHGRRLGRVEFEIHHVVLLSDSAKATYTLDDPDLSQLLLSRRARKKDDTYTCCSAKRVRRQRGSTDKFRKEVRHKSRVFYQEAIVS